MSKSAQQHDINWLYAPAVPVEVLQMLAAGKTPAGEVIHGPQGQTTYRGLVREQFVPIGA